MLVSLPTMLDPEAAIANHTAQGTIEQLSAMAKQTYFQFAMTKIGKVRAVTAEGPVRDAALRDAGGLNMTAGYIAGGVCAAIVVLNIVLLVILG